jgi:hypothetical protein
VPAAVIRQQAHICWRALVTPARQPVLVPAVQRQASPRVAQGTLSAMVASQVVVGGVVMKGGAGLFGPKLNAHDWQT